MENENYIGVGGPNYTPKEELPFAKAVGRIFGSTTVKEGHTVAHLEPQHVHDVMRFAADYFRVRWLDAGSRKKSWRHEVETL